MTQGSQLHTNQIFGSDPAALLDQVDAAAKRLSGRIVKLHIAAVDNATIESVAAQVKQRYAQALPAVTSVTGKLSAADAKLAIDAVIAFKGSPKDGQRVEEDSFGRILHPGSRVYISGQAEQDSAQASAAVRTMQSLAASLDFVKANLDDVVQVKAFLTPIKSEKVVRQEIQSFFGNRKVPLVIVEWSSNLPIEIELIAACPAGADKSNIEYLTPPAMKSSTLYARIARVNVADTIYIGGLFAGGSKAMNGEGEVKDIFATMQASLKEAGSDLDNLVKATYYCANEDTSLALNKLRPGYYNPPAPPPLPRPSSQAPAATNAS